MKRSSFVFGVAVLLWGWTAAQGQGLKAVPYGTGSLKGTVRLAGNQPDIQAMNADLEQMLRRHPDHERFFSILVPREEREQQTWRIGPKGELANVHIWLVPEPGTFFAVDDRHPGVRAATDCAV